MPTIPTKEEHETKEDLTHEMYISKGVETLEIFRKMEKHFTQKNEIEMRMKCKDKAFFEDNRVNFFVIIIILFRKFLF